MLRERHVPWNRAVWKTLLFLSVFIGDAVIVMIAADRSRYSRPPQSWDDKVFDVAVRGEHVILEIYLEPNLFLMAFNKIDNAQESHSKSMCSLNKNGRVLVLRSHSYFGSGGTNNASILPPDKFSRNDERLPSGGSGLT